MDLLRPAVLVALLAGAIGACGGSGGPDATPAPGATVDGGADGAPDDSAIEAGSPADGNAARTVTVTTLASAVPGSPGGKANATWAAWQADAGPWQPIMPSSLGTYSFTVTGARWALALACADGTASSAVDIHRRPADVTALDVTLEPECLTMPAAFYTLSGTLSNVPSTTSWLELGYGLESRGSALGVTGTSAPYELVNVVGAGTWDFTFGLRDDSGGPLTRVLVQRGRAFTADSLLDLDFAAALVPIPQPLVIHGLDTGEIVDTSIFYSSDGFAGLAVGPPNVPTTTPDVTTSYDALPAASQVGADRYRATLVAGRDKSSAVVRTIEASFHAAAALDFTLPPAMGMPVATAKKSGSIVEISAQAPVYTGAASYALVATVLLNDRSRRAFRTTLAPSMVAETFVLTPDLASVPGFDPSWLLPTAAAVDVAAVAVEAPAPLGDGTRARTSSHKITITITP